MRGFLGGGGVIIPLVFFKMIEPIKFWDLSFEECDRLSKKKQKFLRKEFRKMGFAVKNTKMTIEFYISDTPQPFSDYHYAIKIAYGKYSDKFKIHWDLCYHHCTPHNSEVFWLSSMVKDYPLFVDNQFIFLFWHIPFYTYTRDIKIEDIAFLKKTLENMCVKMNAKIYTNYRLSINFTYKEKEGEPFSDQHTLFPLFF